MLVKCITVSVLRQVREKESATKLNIGIQVACINITDWVDSRKQTAT